MQQYHERMQSIYSQSVHHPTDQPTNQLKIQPHSLKCITETERQRYSQRARLRDKELLRSNALCEEIKTTVLRDAEAQWQKYT